MESVIGVLADTHIPDRSRRLHPQIMEIFTEAKVEMILHAGDISIPRVLRELEKIAPVKAVRGNRDFFWSPKLDLHLVIEVQGKKIGMTHGHGSFSLYLKDKARYLLKGQIPTFDFFVQRAKASLPDGVDVIIFGHNHAPMRKWQDGKLLFNPGSACCHVFKDRPESVGLLRISPGLIQAEIIDLDH